MDQTMNNKTVLITGANGFVGARLCEILAERSYRVRALVRKSSDLFRLSGVNVTLAYGELGDFSSMVGAVDDVDIVIHAAGRIKAPNLAQYMEANKKGTRNLLAAIREAAPKLERFVYVSSLAAGGPGLNAKPVTESDPPRPVTPYGASKLAGEKETLAQAGKLPVTIVRPPAVYGPGDTQVLGFFRTVCWHIKPYFGTPNALLRLVYVDDLVEGLLLAAQKKEALGEVFYIADDKNYTWLELETIIAREAKVWAVPVRIPKWFVRSVAAVSELAYKPTGKTPAMNRHKAEDFLQANWSCSVAKAQRMLGYRCRFPFEKGAAITIAAYREKGWL
jgi:nucleoside-diphosphate-sugar epimerase